MKNLIPVIYKTSIEDWRLLKDNLWITIKRKTLTLNESIMIIKHVNIIGDHLK